MDGDIGPVGRRVIRLQASGQIVVAVIGVLGLPGAAAAEDVGAGIHRRQDRGPGKIQIGRGCIRSIVRKGRARIIDRIGCELVQIVLRGRRYPIHDRIGLVRGPDSELVERRGVKRPGLRNPGLLLECLDGRFGGAARDPVQGAGIETQRFELRLGLLGDRVIAGGLSRLRQSQSEL